MTTPRCSLTEAVNMIDGYRRNRPWKWVIAHVAHITGWSAGRLEAAYDRRFHAWSEAHGYDFT
jgi:hypothetical protein